MATCIRYQYQFNVECLPIFELPGYSAQRVGTEVKQKQKNCSSNWQSDIKAPKTVFQRLETVPLHSTLVFCIWICRLLQIPETVMIHIDHTLSFKTDRMCAGTWKLDSFPIHYTSTPSIESFHTLSVELIKCFVFYIFFNHRCNGGRLPITFVLHLLDFCSATDTF